jgi:G:T-mismatch repair DNA endonuclease (very short patch repair protein)
MFTVDCWRFPHSDCAMFKNGGASNRRDLQLNIEELELLRRVLTQRGFHCETIWSCAARNPEALRVRLSSTLHEARATKT